MYKVSRVIVRSINLRIADVGLVEVGVVAHDQPHSLRGLEHLVQGVDDAVPASKAGSLERGGGSLVNVAVEIGDG